MRRTTSWAQRPIGTHHLVWLFALLLVPGTVEARQTGWREHFARGERARGEGDLATYAESMSAAVGAMPEGLLNRPFAQYHAARANALLGRRAEAVRYLRMAWDEGLESLMISYAEHDPAFDGMRGDPGLVEVLSLGASTDLGVRALAGNAYLLTGAGSNLVASVGEDGVLLIDTGYGPALSPLRRALASLGANAVDLLVLTHAHEDHVGSAAGLGPEAVILGHPATARSMSEPTVFIEGVEIPAKPAEASPDRLPSADTTLTFNGELVRIHPVSAHTQGDLAVYLSRSAVLHLGDAFLGGNPMMFPGASDPDGFLDDLERFLDELDPQTVVVGGHDPPTDLDAVRAQISETRACMAFVRQSLERGRSLEETVASSEERFSAPWIGYFYRVFSESAAGS